jgi:hypothetical protein
MGYREIWEKRANCGVSGKREEERGERGERTTKNEGKGLKTRQQNEKGNATI